MTSNKDFNEWRAEKLGYVYFSRLSDLIIKERDADNAFFDYLIDIGNNQRQTGRLFGVEVKALNGTPINVKSVSEKYKNVSFPLVLVTFDNHTDKGYFKWIKKPKQDCRLLLDDTSNKMNSLDDTSLTEIVNEVKDWYKHQTVASE